MNPQVALSAFRWFTAVLVLLLCAACARGYRTHVDTSKSTTIVHYHCEDGTVLKAAITPDTLILGVGDRQHTLARVPSASGARYEAERVMFWDKGGQAIVETEGRTHGECTLVEE